MGWLKQMAWAGMLWIAGAAHAAATPPPQAACPAASAASVASPAGAAPKPCIEKAASPVVRATPAPAPAVTQQVTLYCGATAASSAPVDTRVKAEAECKKAADGGTNKVSVKLPKGIGIDFESGNTLMTYLVFAVLVLILVGSLWFVADKVKGADAEKPGVPALVIAGLVFFGLGGVLGYWWKDDRVVTLDAREVDKLVGNQDFGRALQRALLDNAQAGEERGQLKARVAALEQELAMANAKGVDAGRPGAGDWTGLLAGLVIGLAGMAGSWHLARVRNVRLEVAVRGAASALLEVSPAADGPPPEGPEPYRRSIRTALRLLRLE